MGQSTGFVTKGALADSIIWARRSTVLICCPV